jgi:hypothetical protein
MGKLLKIWSRTRHIHNYKPFFDYFIVFYSSYDLTIRICFITMKKVCPSSKAKNDTEKAKKRMKIRKFRLAAGIYFFVFCHLYAYIAWWFCSLPKNWRFPEAYTIISFLYTHLFFCFEKINFSHPHWDLQPIDPIKEWQTTILSYSFSFKFYQSRVR